MQLQEGYRRRRESLLCINRDLITAVCSHYPRGEFCSIWGKFPSFQITRYCSGIIFDYCRGMTLAGLYSVAGLQGGWATNVWKLLLEAFLQPLERQGVKSWLRSSVCVLMFGCGVGRMYSIGAFLHWTDKIECIVLLLTSVWSEIHWCPSPWQSGLFFFLIKAVRWEPHTNSPSVTIVRLTTLLNRVCMNIKLCRGLGHRQEHSTRQIERRTDRVTEWGHTFPEARAWRI